LGGQHAVMGCAALFFYLVFMGHARWATSDTRRITAKLSDTANVQALAIDAPMVAILHSRARWSLLVAFFETGFFAVLTGK